MQRTALSVCLLGQVYFISSCFYDRFVRYVEGEHYRQCPPETIASGLEKLPLAYGYKDGSADTNIVATQRLPNGQRLEGRNSYKSLMRFFTTFDITPEVLREKAQKRLDELLPQVIILTSMHTRQVAHQARTYPGFCSMKRLKILLLSPGWDANPSRGYT